MDSRVEVVFHPGQPKCTVRLRLSRGALDNPHKAPYHFNLTENQAEALIEELRTSLSLLRMVEALEEIRHD